VYSKRKVESQDCRTSSQSDILGTVQGAWFEPGKYGSVFAISTSMSGLVLATFSAHAETGASFDIKVPPEDAIYIGPAKITSKHCYQTNKAYSGNTPPMYVNLDLVSLLHWKWSTARAPVKNVRQSKPCRWSAN